MRSRRGLFIRRGKLPVDSGTQPSDGSPADAGPMPLEGGGSILALRYSTNDLVFDPKRHVLYASVDAPPGATGNSVLIIDPASATVTGMFPVGGIPSFLAISDDASALYVAITTPGSPVFTERDGGDLVLRIDLASMMVGAPVSLGSNVVSKLTAGQIAAVPGSSTQYVVSRRQPGFTPDFAGLALYDGATLLAEANNLLAGDAIAFSDPSTLFGCSNGQSPSDFIRFTVAPTAITAGKDVPGLISEGETRIIVNGGSIFVNDGHVVSVATMDAVGTYSSGTTDLFSFPSAGFLPDADGANVWFLNINQGGYFFLLDFDRTTFVLRRSISLSPAVGDSDLQNARALVRWSSTGLAFRTINAVYLLTIPN